MSALQQCLAGQAVTRHLASGSVGYGRIAVTTSLSGLWIHCCSRSCSNMGIRAGTRVRSTANGQFRHADGYGHALQWRRNMSYDARARMKTSAKCATWFVQNPGQILPSDIVSQLPILAHSEGISHIVPVVLVTPKFASWVMKTHPFLSESVTHMFQNARQNISSSEDSIVYSIAAVVDKLPVPSATSGLREVVEWGDKLAGQHGCEGVSLLLANRDALSAEVGQSILQRDMSTPEMEPTLSYLFHQPTTKQTSPAQATFAEVGVRLANTLFVNGKSRTMLASRWRHSSYADLTSIDTTLTLDKECDLVSCRVECAKEPHAVAAHVPLHPVTEPRKIVTSMGNIISQLCRGDGSGSTIPASTELEKALPAYLKENNLENQRVAVWALVQPVASNDERPVSSDMTADANVNTNGRNKQMDPFVAINNGATLHRVVSGGGGWGKKQGLLSLDPEYSYQAEYAAAVSGQVRRFRDIFEETASGSEAGVRDRREPMLTLFDEVPGSIQFKDDRLLTDLSEIAKEGDMVQFLTAPLDNPEATMPVEEASSIDADETRTTQISFGVIPSSDASWSAVEEEEEEEEQASAAEQGSISPCDRGILAIPNHFGALSEKGLVYSIYADEVLGDDNDKQRPGQLLLGTKIDVPGSSIMIESAD
ncbi:hypothetical protein AJ78_05490 [Emergomyces pasteurianus Ep9510]|uniref:Uncharacterized protein n=1 Tax=Emergomyces pasteurianus Ep9510 TaxID=1447872 RepID=A0A1J9QG41_9EURO|nr:hypothetical protein AJ78_05490 [Emergomyces pasteurianus Ep9510]